MKTTEDGYDEKLPDDVEPEDHEPGKKKGKAKKAEPEKTPERIVTPHVREDALDKIKRLRNSIGHGSLEDKLGGRYWLKRAIDDIELS